MDFATLVTWVAAFLEALGLTTIVLGVPVALVLAARSGRRREAYRTFRQAVGKGILLGLEFLVGADIVRTVSAVPTLSQVTVLGLIVLIRTFLSFTLEVELDGRWPWQRGADAPAPEAEGSGQ